MQEVLADAEGCAAMLEEHGSPLNLHDFSALARNAAELERPAERAGVRLRIFAARKANKTLGMMDAAHAAGHGVDVGSYRELAQALDRGIPAADIVVTAAVKPRPLLRLALDSGALLVLDNLDEASSLAAEVADRQEAGSHPIALRLAPTPDELIAPTRFGESACPVSMTPGGGARSGWPTTGRAAPPGRRSPGAASACGRSTPTTRP